MRHDLTLTSPDGTETHVLSIGTSWADYTLQQFIDWQCSELPAICVLAGITPEQLERLAASDAGYLLNLLSFATELPDPPAAPDLKDVGEASYGQMVLATQYLQQHEDKPPIYCAPYLYALYRSREVFGRYDERRIAEMEAAIRLEPVDQVLGTVLFTMAAWLDSMRRTLPPPTPPTTPRPTPRNLMQAWKSSKIGSRCCSLLTRWQNRWASRASNSSKTTTRPLATPR